MADYGKVTLGIYEITIYKEGDKSKNYVLSDFCNGKDLYSFFKECMESWIYTKSNNDENLTKDEVNQKVIRIKRNNENNPFIQYFGRSYSGLFESGDYGDERTLIDINTGEPKYEQKDNDAPLIPFYFLFHIEQGTTSGLLVLQRFRQFGVYSLSKNIFTKAFKEKYPKYTLNIEKLSTTELVKKSLESAELKGFTLKHVSHGNVSSQTVGQSIQVNPKDYELELKYRAKRNRFFPTSLKDSILDKNKFISIEGLNYETTTFQIKIGGNERSFTRQQLDEFGYSCDISKKVKWGADKMPTYESVNNEARSLINDILKEMKDSKK